MTRSRPPNPHLPHGFTLVETLIVIALFAIIVGIGVPAFQDFITRKALDAHVSLLASTLRNAQISARNLSSDVTVCPSLAPNAANPTCSATADWSTGWITFRDYPPLRNLDNGDPILAVQDAVSNSGGITASAGAAYMVRYSPTGFGLGNLGNTFTFNSKTGMGSTRTRTMTVSAQGETR